MQVTSWAILGVVGLATTATAGDWLLKLASVSARPFRTPWFLMGVMIYALTTLGWIHVMRHLKLATTGVVFAVTNVLLLAAVGVFVFRESLHWTELLGLTFGILSLCFLARAA
jgi:multidrug transporter EmrE-like cation transporter